MNAGSVVKSGRFAIAAASALSLAACSAILGLTDPVVDNSIGDGGGQGDSSGGDGAVGDGAPSGDGGSDSATTCSSADDFDADTHNCGSCGHDCYDGTCDQGQCLPVLVVDNASTLSPYDITEMAGFLYFTNLNGTVAALAKVDKTAINSSPPASVIVDWTATMHGSPYQVAAAGGNVYFAAYDSFAENGLYKGAVMKCTTTACPGALTVGGISAYAVATDGTNVAYGGIYEDDAGDDRYRLAKSDLSLASSTVLAADFGDEINYLKIDDGKIYIASPSGVFVCPLGGCPSGPTKLTPLDADELSIANGRVYFSSQPSVGTYSFQWVATSGGSVTQISGTPIVPLAIIADTKLVYMADFGDNTNPTTGRVYECPLAGCGANDSNAITLSRGLATADNPRGLLDDGKYIYWGTRSGKIWKVAK